ncbi:uncharacterized protein CTRU02_200479 [Colletotrichum truncatum]|uniref:Uncharacterized protein n=1 Tax=Colletotrichum truncatum TaxID=5467 RepID=A0ACC3ZEP0_COLTU|nr:uncharacterized protein CTRU02_00240 [Colletotrichum truncatum]KAF6801491.1 hypothetical protein CTRU02_00240 [Colletotrichum truncatum]
MAESLTHVAFFGVTGGAVFNCLKQALLDESIHCYVLVRDTDKLKNLLRNSMGDPPYAFSHRLLVVKGDIVDIDVVVSTLFPARRTWDPVDVIVYGVSGFKLDINTEGNSITDAEICTYGVDIIEEATLKGYESYHYGIPYHYPRFVAIGTLGIGAAFRNTSSAQIEALKPSYDWFIESGAYEDKILMEEIISHRDFQGLFRNTLIVRPGFLTNNAPFGLNSIRVGTRNIPPLGYTISRDNLGCWLYQHGILGNMTGVILVTGP